MLSHPLPGQQRADTEALAMQLLRQHTAAARPQPRQPNSLTTTTLPPTHHDAAAATTKLPQLPRCQSCRPRRRAATATAAPLPSCHSCHAAVKLPPLPPPPPPLRCHAAATAAATALLLTPSCCHQDFATAANVGGQQRTQINCYTMVPKYPPGDGWLFGKSLAIYLS